jgi:predicted Zn-dependent protease
MELARALIYLKRREEALSLLVASAALQHGSRQKALISRVRVLSRLFLLQRTFQMYQDGLNALQAGKYRPARELFEKALQAEPDNIEILIRIGQCMIFEGDYDSAVERLRLAKRLNPYEPEIRLWLGQAMKERGELEEALTELKFAQEGLGNSARSPLWYAEALLVSGNPRDAVLVLERDEKAHPFHLINILALVRARMQLFRNGGDSLWSARKNLQAALSRLPQDGTGNELRFESELGIELRKPTAELKTEITSLLAQLDNSLKAQE